MPFLLFLSFLYIFNTKDKINSKMKKAKTIIYSISKSTVRKTTGIWAAGGQH